MDGTNRIGWYVTSYASGYYPAATGDFDGDGLVDIMWTSAKNDLYVWLGNARKSTGFTPKFVTNYPAGWSIVGRGDIDGDGRDDLIWMQSSGTSWGYWLMNGATIKSTTIDAVSAGETLAAVGDFSGRGFADLVWNNNGVSLDVWTNTSGLQGTQLNISFSRGGVFPGVDASMPVFNSGIPPATVTH